MPKYGLLVVNHKNRQTLGLRPQTPMPPADADPRLGLMTRECARPYSR